MDAAVAGVKVVTPADGGEGFLKGAGGVMGGGGLDEDGFAGELVGDTLVEQGGDLVAGGVEIFHEGAEHGAAFGHEAVIEGVTGEAAGADVFEDEDGHGEDGFWGLGSGSGVLVRGRGSVACLAGWGLGRT